MATSLLNTDLNLGNIKKLVVSLSDDDKSLQFAVIVNKQNADKPAASVTVAVTEQQADLLVKLSRRA